MRARAVWRPPVRSRRFGVAATASAAPPQPLDPQNWSFQDNLTWSDYKPIPGRTTRTRAIEPTVKKWKVALILVDYPDRPFTITRPPAHIFGTPTASRHSIPRDQVPQFYADFLNKPTALNNFQTMNRYWMEDSFGKLRRRAGAVRPVPAAAEELPVPHRRTSRTTTADCPNPRPRDAEPDAVQPELLQRRAQRLAGRHRRRAPMSARPFDNMFWTSAGQDESGAWQEFGEMRFTSQDA